MMCEKESRTFSGAHVVVTWALFIGDKVRELEQLASA